MRGAASGAEPGSVFWDGCHGHCRAAFVFAPDRPLDGPTVMLDFGALALFDALAVLAPPQVPLHIIPPDGLALDGGRVASVRAAEASVHTGGVPEWVVLGIDVAIDVRGCEPGETPDRTCLMEEGFGEITAEEVISHASRYLLHWLDAWTQDGAAALAQAVAQRVPPRMAAA